MVERPRCPKCKYFVKKAPTVCKHCGMLIEDVRSDTEISTRHGINIDVTGMDTKISGNVVVPSPKKRSLLDRILGR